MKINILYRFLTALLFLSVFSACSLREIYDLNNSENFSDRIEFVGRPAGFNNQTVETKAEASGDIETKIYSCYLLLFNNTPKGNGDNTPQGDLLFCSSNLIPNGTAMTSIPAQKLPINKKENQKIKACYIVNVPDNFIYDSNGKTILNNISDLNSAVLGPNHFSYAEHTSSVPMGIPEITINKVKTQCIPAYGEVNIDVNNGITGPVEISIKRLFSKVVIDLRLVLSSGSQAGDALQNWLKYTSFKFISYELKNLPSKVKLVESNDESAWVMHEDSESFATSSDKTLILGGINTTLTNNQSTQFYFYAPEYYLSALSLNDYLEQNTGVSSTTYGTQEYKPKMFKAGKKPLHINILGQYSPYALSKTNLTYEIYLGENESSSFTLKRNVCYTNTLQITGANNSKDGTGATIDHRVSAVTINDVTIASGEAANCYIYTTNGKYSFPTYQGAYTSLTEAKKNMCVGGVKVVKKAQTNFSDITPVQITELTYSDNEISFDLSIGTGGNVVLELQDANNNPIWSWHLWVLALGDNDNIGIANITLPNGATIMNRNLGSYAMTTLLSEGQGLYYKYGCKEPFIVDDYKGGGTLYNSNGEAITPSWDAAKSPTDPCPPGYKVPTSKVWSSSTSLEHASLDATGIVSNGVFKVYDNIYFPYSGHVSNKSIIDKTTSNYSPERTYKDEMKNLISNVGVKFKNIKYLVPINKRNGSLLTIDKLVEYYSCDDGFVLSNISITYYQWSQTYIIGWTKYADRTNETDIAYALPLQEVKERLANLSEVKALTNPSFNPNVTLNKSNGYQVRCVSKDSKIQ